jgi:hypothetical protein
MRAAARFRIDATNQPHGVKLMEGFPSRRTSCLALPFDDAQAAEVARTETANARRVPKR